jgi:alpha-glucosidase
MNLAERAEKPARWDAAWWQHGVIYQIYPRSFQDANGDGIGDLKGITQRLDYLTWLGVDAIWLSPIFPSPMRDFGYDISDYTDIAPIFGSLADFDELLAAAHRRGLKLILDFVPNHTSDRHPWFQESRRERENACRDWYVWRDPAPDGGPPNNWLSEFGGSAWEYDAASGQYYYHAFLSEQPDLNWRNPALRDAMHDVLRFWLKRGVDGFRIDVLHHLIEDAGFRNNPPNPNYGPGMRPSSALLPAHTVDQPEIQDIIVGMRKVVDEYAERVLIGEIHLPIQRLVTYYGVELNGIHLPFNFNLLNARWTATVLSDLITTYESALPKGAWPNWVIGNHDISRVATRVGPQGARLAAMLLLTLRGTPTLYYGDELGMSDVPIPPELVQDPFEKNVPGIGVGRDPARTPMRWQAEAEGGFTAGRPWLPVGSGLESSNVEAQKKEPASMLSLHRSLLQLRRAHPALSIGSYSGFRSNDECLVFMRQHERERILVLLNFSGDRQAVELPPEMNNGRILFSSAGHGADLPASRIVELEPAEGLLIVNTG